MKKVIGGKTYMKVPAQVNGTCEKCAAQYGSELCAKLHIGENGVYTPGICTSIGKIFKEQIMSEKTALELVDELDRHLTGGPLGCHDPTATNLIRSVKSAIEREQGQAVARFAKQCNETAQAELKLRELQKSAIVMRPIAELPDRVPDGCVIVAVGKLRVTIKCWVWEPGEDVFPHKGETHFYILPLPKPARRLHPCYMPGCGGDVVPIYDYHGRDPKVLKSWYVFCQKCGARGARCDTEEESKNAWGYE
jgi:hypothetical protein